MKLKKFLTLITFALIVESVGILGGLFTAPAVSSQWYSDLAKPFLQPPSWVFAPVWTTLYLLMGIAAFLVWDSGKRRSDVQKALGVFGVQLLLNLTWSIFFRPLFRWWSID